MLFFYFTKSLDNLILSVFLLKFNDILDYDFYDYAV